MSSATTFLAFFSMNSCISIHIFSSTSDTSRYRSTSCSNESAQSKAYVPSPVTLMKTATPGKRKFWITTQ